MPPLAGLGPGLDRCTNGSSPKTRVRNCASAALSLGHRAYERGTVRQRRASKAAMNRAHSKRFAPEMAHGFRCSRQRVECVRLAAAFGSLRSGRRRKSSIWCTNPPTAPASGRTPNASRIPARRTCCQRAQDDSVFVHFVSSWCNLFSHGACRRRKNSMDSLAGTVTCCIPGMGNSWTGSQGPWTVGAPSTA